MKYKMLKYDSDSIMIKYKFLNYDNGSMMNKQNVTVWQF